MTMSCGDQGDAGSSDCDEGVYYFGYGPMVHPLVRHRRGIKVVEEEPAILRDYRLTFSYGGAATMVPQRGWEIHGILMKCQTQADWEILKQSESGAPAVEVNVHPYRNKAIELPVFSPEEEEEDDDDDNVPIRARAFVMSEFDNSSLDSPLDRLPHERYLRLIAAGLAKHNVDEDYVQDQILGVPYRSSRKPENYSTFPVLQLPNRVPEETDTETETDEPLPKISWEGYQQLCHEKAGDPTNLYFIVGRNVILIRDNPGKVHPGAIWHQSNAHGKKDVTFYLHQTHVDLDIPYCETEEAITPRTQAWAENQLVHSIAQGLNAHRVFELSQDVSSEESDESIRRLRAFLETSTNTIPKRRRRRSTLTKLTSRIKKELTRGRRHTTQA